MKRTILGLVAMLALAAFAAGTAPARAPLKVGYVIDSGWTPDRGSLFGLPYAGFISAVQQLKLPARVVSAAPNQDPTGPLSLLARQRYDLVIMGIPFPDAAAVVAREFPGTKFMFPDHSIHELDGAPPQNLQGSIFRDEQAGYLAGYLAGLMEKRQPGRDVVGAVGGKHGPGVDRWIVGYRAGAKRADPGIVTLTTYTNNFVNPTRCKSAALDQIAKGAGVIFNVAGNCGIGTLEAAKEKKVWGVGVDVDQSFLGPHILTSAVANLDVAVRIALERLVAGKLTTGGDTVFDLRNGGVGLGRISPQVPRSIVRQVDRVRRQIIAGKIRVKTVG